MKLFIIPLCIVGAIFAIALAGPLTERWEQRNSYEAQVEELDLLRRQSQLQDFQQQTAATAASRALASNAGYLGVVLLGALGIAYAIDRAARRREPLVRFGGELVPRRLVESGRLIEILAHRLEMQDIALIEDKRRAIPPHVYSPHLSIRGGTDLALPEIAPALASAATVPTFAQLLASGRVGKGNPLVLGYDETDASEISGSWLDLYSTAIAGLPGTGKTTTQRFLACQTALQGARFAVIDPHQGAADDSLAATLAPLASAFVCEPASDDRAILETVRYVADVGHRRITGKDSDATPLILWADELTALLGRSSVAGELAELLERVAQEYRKRHVFICGSGQIFTAARTTSELRDSFASAIVHRMRRNQARLLLPTEEAAQVERLQTGHAVLWRTSGATQTIVIPNTTAADVETVARRLGEPSKEPSKEPSSARPFGFVGRQAEGRWKASPEGSEGRPAAEKPTIEAARIIALFVAGKSIPEIVKAVFGLDSNSGRAYVEKRAEVERVLRSALVERAA